MFNKNIILLYLISLFLIEICSSDEVDTHSDDEYDKHVAKVSENRLTAQLFAVLDHYKQNDPVGLPGVPVPDPMPVPDIKKSIGMATLTMKNVLAHGLSKFRIKYVKSDLKDLKVNSGIQLDEMKVMGKYTLSSVFSRAGGPFTVLLKNVFVAGNATLAVERDGKLKTQDINIDITFSDMTMNFEDLGFLGSIFQGIVNAAPNLVFDAIKPFMLTEAYTKIRSEIDTNIAKMSGNHSFPNSIAPLDMAIAEGRKQVRSMGYDPFHIPDYNHTVGVFSVKMENTWLIGASSFYRVGNVSITLENNTVSARLQVGTQKITGMTQWEVSVINGMITRAGQAQFTVNHIKATIEVSQPLDTRKKPQIKDLQFDLGNIQVRCDGAGTLDYAIEFLVNILPNLLRYQIMDAIENPIKIRIQETMNGIDVEKAIKENIDKFQNNGRGGEMKFDFKF